MTKTVDNNIYSASLPEVVVKGLCIESLAISEDNDYRHYTPLFKYIADNCKVTEGMVYAIIKQESSFRSGLFKKHLNFGGTKGRRSNRKVSMRTHEIIDGKRINIYAKFNSYDSLKDSADDFIDMINTVYDKHIPDNPTNKEVALGLKRGGYHTDNSHWTRLKYANEYDKKTLGA